MTISTDFLDDLRRDVIKAKACIMLSSAIFLNSCLQAPSTSKRENNPGLKGEIYPCLLHAASSLSPEFSVNQHLEIRVGSYQGEFDAILQKSGNKLVVVGLGPLGSKAFELIQNENNIEFKHYFGPTFPFPPKLILIDVHRSFFKRLQTPGSLFFSGEFHENLDDEFVTEKWESGQLLWRTFERKGQVGKIKISYGDNCNVRDCKPRDLIIVNEWLHYSLHIQNEGYATF